MVATTFIINKSYNLIKKDSCLLTGTKALSITALQKLSFHSLSRFASKHQKRQIKFSPTLTLIIFHRAKLKVKAMASILAQPDSLVFKHNHQTE